MLNVNINTHCKLNNSLTDTVYGLELRTLILERFHNQVNHRNYHRTYSAISENHIGITQEEVQEYVSK